MYITTVMTTSGEEFQCDFDTLSQAVSYATNTAREGDKVQIFEILDGLCGPEVQDLVMEYIEDGWKGYD